MAVPTKIKFIVLTSFIFIFSASCSSEIEDMDDKKENVNTSNEDIDDNNPINSCNDTSKFIFNEKDALVLIEFENTSYSSGWELIEDTSNATGKGYLEWKGNNSFSSPGGGLATYKIKINTSGIYRFVWKSAVKEGNNGTEANDTWLRFNDADDFYGENANGNVIYPKGTGKTPNPNGSSADGWFKVYRSGNDLDFKWQSRTSDHDAHDIFIKFNNEGIYTMEVSGRSKGHAIDKFLLYQPKEYSFNDAIKINTFSAILCD